MSIQELMSVVKAPSRPLETGDKRAWAKLEADLGLQLPSDLYEFGLHYGTGRFWQGEIEVLNPFSKLYHKFLESEINRLRLARELGLDVPYESYPKRPGLFPWGRVDGGTMYWLTDGQPEFWPIVLQKIRPSEWERLEMPMTTFLAKALKNELKCLLWESLPPEACNFESRKS